MNRFSIVSLLALAAIIAGCQPTPTATPVAMPPGSNPTAAAPAGAPAAPLPDGPPAGADAPASGKKYVFAFIPKSLTSPVFNYARIGAERQAEKYGDVEIRWRGPVSHDPEEQRRIIEEMVAARVNGIAISCLSDALTPAIDAAVAAGIPVVTFDSDAPGSRRLAFYGLDDQAAGRLLAEEAVKLMGSAGGEIALLTKVGADNLDQRVTGAMAVISAHPEIKVAQTFDVGSEGAVTAARIVKGSASTYPNLRGWLSLGGWPSFSPAVLETIDPARVFVVTMDTIPPGPEQIRKGKIQLALGQKYFGWGSVCTRLLREAMDGRRPASDFIDSGVDPVTPRNVEQYLRKWERMERGEIVE